MAKRRPPKRIRGWVRGSGEDYAAAMSGRAGRRIHQKGGFRWKGGREIAPPALPEGAQGT